METKKFTRQLGGRELKIEISSLAEQANGAVIAQYGDTVVLATAVMSKNARDNNFLPLFIDYEEKLYAAGKIKGSRFIKRETRPTDEAILSDRLVDRVIRPCFNQKIRNEIQIVLTILSIDQENDPDIVGVIGAVSALLISDIPFTQNVSALRVGEINGEFVINPTYQQREEGLFDLVVGGDGETVNMLEGGLKEVSAKRALEAIDFAKKYLKEICAFQKEIVKEIQPEKIKIEIKNPDAAVNKKIQDFLKEKMSQALYVSHKQKRQNTLSQLKEELLLWIDNELKQGIISKSEIENIFEEVIDEIVHQNVLEKGLRPDGRKLDELRQIECRVGVLPRPHGSGLFIRGETQALCVITLGSPGDEQFLDEMEKEGRKRFMLHYNFPPFSVGETAPMRGPGRREIGHGALAEKALLPLIPNKEEFFYTIRVVSEILSSNGSSSMASVCAGSLSLMDAGVPLKEAVAGISMGLITDKKGNFKVLTDIQGPEDHHGDMDLKIAGTKNGLTALQMDIKIEGVSGEILKAAFLQGGKALGEIFEKMNAVIAKPRLELSPFAPRVEKIQINPEKIREVIGPKGKTINSIIDQTGVDIDIEDSGSIFITAKKPEAAKKAIDWILNITREVKVGEVFQGRITRIFNFGAMAEILPGQEGLIHISEFNHYAKRITDMVKPGEIIPVKVKNIDEQGRINLTLKNGKQ